MLRSSLPLNALRAFEAAARHQNFTRAALELHVSQAALSHQIRGLESRLEVVLFHRLARGVALTDEGAALYPMLNESFDRIAALLDRFAEGRYRQSLHVGVVGTFSTGWLLPRLSDFATAHPAIDLRIQTHNNRVDLAGEGLELAIRFGEGDWQGQHCTPLMAVRFAPLCAPGLAEGLRTPQDLSTYTLLRTYRHDEWTRWCAAAGMAPLDARGAIFDSSLALAAAATSGAGVALLPIELFQPALDSGQLVQPFDLHIHLGRYWLNRLRSRPESPAGQDFRRWLERALDHNGAATD